MAKQKEETKNKIKKIKINEIKILNESMIKI